MAEQASQEVERFVWVRRQWNDWRSAKYRFEDLDGVHWSDLSGGIQVAAPRAFLHAYVWCDALLEGELAHSCRHGQGPHRIKVCIVQKDNPKPIITELKALAEARSERV